MTLLQQIITIAMVVLGTAITRFLPFIVFPADKPVPKYVQYLGKVLPSAVFGLLVIYCLRNVSIFTGSHGIPELISIVLVIALHLAERDDLHLPGEGCRYAVRCIWKRSVAGGDDHHLPDGLLPHQHGALAQLLFPSCQTIYALS